MSKPEDVKTVIAAFRSMFSTQRWAGEWGKRLNTVEDEMKRLEDEVFRLTKQANAHRDAQIKAEAELREDHKLQIEALGEMIVGLRAKKSASGEKK